MAEGRKQAVAETTVLRAPDERLAFKTELLPAPDQPVADSLDRPAATVDAPVAPAARPAKRRRRPPRLADIKSGFARALVDESEFGTPFLLIPVLMLCGVTLYFSLATEPARHNIAAGLIVMVLCWIVTRRKAPLLARALLAALIVLAGMGIAQWHTLAKSTQMLGSEVTSHLTGRIVRIEPRANGSVRYTLDVLRTERPQLFYAPDRLRVTARNAVPGARVGDGLEGRARLRPPSGPVRPGGYDFAFHGYFAGHGANGFFYGAPDKVALTPSNGLLVRADIWLQNARLWLAARITAAAPGDAGTVSAALVTGHKTAIPEPINEALRVSGLAHILSISGMHMALVALTVMGIMRAGFALSGGFSSAHATKKYAAMTAFGAIFIYLFLAGASVATQRSFIMLAVMLGALMMDRAAITKRNLAIAAIIIIVLFPSAATGPSFHMSFAATLALIALYDIWNRARSQRYRERGFVERPSNARAAVSGVSRFFIALAATSIVAGTASGFYAAYHFQRVSVLGLFTNLAAMPIVSVLTMPLAIMATLAIPFGLDGYFYGWMAASAGWILMIAQWVADHSPDGMVGAMSNAAMIAMTTALVWFCICRTWLRWGAMVPLAAVLALMADRPMPLAVVSEDGRQFAVIGTDGALAVNRQRPSSFILEQWQMAYAARQVIKPETGEEAASEEASLLEPMRCDEEICTAQTERDGTVYRMAIVSAPVDDETRLCAQNVLLILAYAPAEPFCGPQTLTLTAQDLALKGSAEIARAPDAPSGLHARHAVSTPFRPWHDHRQYSRSARNLASRY